MDPAMYAKDFSLRPSRAEPHRSTSVEFHGIEAPPEYEQQRQAYESLWQNTATAAPPPEQQQPHPQQDAQTGGKLSLRDRFKKMVGADTFIPESKLHYIKTVGSGSFATVEICSLDSGASPLQQVAVKRLKASSGIGIHDLASEARILAKLHHRSIVEYIGVGYRDDDSAVEDTAAGCYIVQQYIGGGTLKQKILSRPSYGKRAYSYADAIRWCCDIADGLTYLHGVNPVVVHRDMKAENILMLEQEDGKLHALICDFGLAVSVLNPELQRRRSQLPTTKSMHHLFSADPLTVKQSMRDMPKQIKAQKSRVLDRELSNFAQSRKNSGPGSTAPPPKPPEAVYDLTGGTGSYCYMAPEITLCKPYNEKVDCFSLGVIVWELFEHTTTSSIVLATGDYDACALYAHKVAGGYRQPISSRWPRALADLISDCWEQRASERPPMKELFQRLQKLQASGICDRWDEEAAGRAKACGCCHM